MMDFNDSYTDPAQVIESWETVGSRSRTDFMDGSGDRENLASRLKEHTLPFLAKLLNCTEEQATDATLTWQSFRDDESGGKNNLTHQYQGSIREHADLFDEMNQAGAGIFLTINRTDGKGRKKQNILQFRALWADLDGKNAKQEFDPEVLEVEPTLWVKSGHGDHLYYCLAKKIESNPTSIERFESILRGIQQVLAPFGADRQVCEVARVMRVPGFFNRKKEPFPLVRLVQTDGPRYSMEEISASYAPMEKPKGSSGREHDQVNNCRAGEVLTFAQDMDRSEVLHRAAVYLEKCSPAISGHEGHKTTFQTALKVITGFDLTIPEAMELLLTNFNERCEPRWTKAELMHKVEDAHQIAQGSPDRGRLLPKSDSRPCIFDGEEHQMVDEAIAALADSKIYNRMGTLVHLLEQDSSVDGNSPRNIVIREVSPIHLRVVLSKAAVFQKTNAKGGTYQTKVPTDLPAMVLSKGEWEGIPSLTGVVEVPVFLADGRILQNPGLDQKSQIYLASASGHQYQVPESPSLEEAIEATKAIEDVICDFPFATSPTQNCNRAAFLAFVLTGVARFAISGPVPFILLEASSEAAGKGLLTRVGCLIALGKMVPCSPVSSNEEELRKGLMPPLLEGDRVAVLDDCPSSFGGHIWNSLITSWPDYSDRILGKTERRKVPANTIWVVTGNNVNLMANSARRALHIRLESQVERPEDRGEFRYPSLIEVVTERHPQLLTAALTILRGFHIAGRPKSGLKKMAGFEAWSDLIRDAVWWVTGEDVCGTQRVLATTSDTGKINQRILLEGIFDLFNEKPFTAQDLFGLIKPATNGERQAIYDAADSLKTGTQDLNTKSLGNVLSNQRGVIASGLQFESFRQNKNGNQYRVVPHRNGPKIVDIPVFIDQNVTNDYYPTSVILTEVHTRFGA